MNRIAAIACAASLLGGTSQMPLPAFAAAPVISTRDSNEIAFSYAKLRADFYKKTQPQPIVNGARTALQARLHKAGIRATLPPIFASANTSRTSAAVAHEVDLAARAAHGKVSPRALAYTAISGMLNSVHDRYTVFLSPKDYAALNQGLDGTSFAGTGIVIQSDPKSTFIDVAQVIPNGPASKAGVEQDDVITAINGISTKGMSTQKASTYLRGKLGTVVRLAIRRDGKALPAPLAITRAEIHDISVYEKMLPGKIGYVELTVFGRDTGKELTSALNELQQGGARAVIMDLRDNGGGYLDAAIDVSSKFIAAGPIVSVESRASNVTTYEAEDTAIAPLPLAVLVNAHTASASEITSGAIQDSGVGTIIGEKTFGKGVVQEILPLPDGSAIKITDARYLTPRNRDINHLGITPDITLPENKGARYGDPQDDTQLVRAMQFLKEEITHASGVAIHQPLHR